MILEGVKEITNLAYLGCARVLFQDVEFDAALYCIEQAVETTETIVSTNEKSLAHSRL